ncbi:MAG: fibronectin type III domain-containing protein, partial [bacterium]|nr:fibronectin type III domain-containing protein [bacterium]
TINFSYNGLYTDSNWLEWFMKKRETFFKQSVAWLDTQTVAPNNIKAVAASSTSVTVSWSPIKYSKDNGGYTLSYRQLPNGQWVEAVVTETKLEKSCKVTGLQPRTKYAFRLQSHTEPHETNSNRIVSDYSKEAKIKTEN